MFFSFAPLFGLLVGIFQESTRRLLQTTSAALFIVACGDPVTGSAVQKDTPVQTGTESVAGSEPLVVRLRDSAIVVGDTTVAVVEDAQLLAQLRRRFFAPSLTWSSSDTSVAVVSASSGMIVARAVGVATISVNAAGRAGSRQLPVVAPADTTPPPAPDPDPPVPPVTGDVAQLQLPPDNPAELPRLQVALPVAEGGGTVRRVPSGNSIQATIDASSPGDVILLAKGGVYTESVRLRKKTGTGWITIRTDDTPTPAGRRVALSDTLTFARIRSPGGNAPAIRTDEAASGYWLVNLDVTVRPNETYLNSLVELSAPSQTRLDQVPSRIILDRLILRGRADLPLRRCLSLQSSHTAVVNSLLLECHEKGFDSQAIAGWNGPGPYLIENNVLEGAGENVIFGGADPAIPGLVPSDITIRWNLFTKQPAWFVSRAWTVKNIFELKNGRRVLVHHNIFEHNWADGQVGFGIVMFSTNQGGKAPWSEVSNVTFSQNVLRSMSSVLNVGGKWGVAVTMSRMLFAGNLLYKIDQESGYPVGGRTLMVLQGMSHLHISDNTILGAQNSAITVAADGNPPKGTNFRYAQNISSFGTYGVWEATGGKRALENRYADFDFVENCFFETQLGNSVAYPLPNRMTPASRSVLFPGWPTDDLTLSAGTACSNPLPSGKRLGADPQLLPLLLQRVIPGLGAP